MAMIQVKAKPGRVARSAPNGQFIPDDRFISIELTPYVARLLNKHGDIVEKPKKVEPAPKPKPAADAVKSPSKD